MVFTLFSEVVGLKSEDIIVLCLEVLAHEAEVLTLLDGAPLLCIVATLAGGCSREEILELRVHASQVLLVQRV